MKNPFCFNNTDLRDSIGAKHFFKRWPRIDSACEPDNIKWGNQNVTEFAIFLRSLFIKILSFIIIVACLVGVVTLKNMGDKITEQNSLDVVCSGLPSKAMAHADIVKKTDREGLMTCFCLPQFQEDFVSAYAIDFSEFENDGLPDENLYCQTWVWEYLLEKSIVVLTSLTIAAVNIFATFLFEKMVVLERQQTVNDETEGLFRKITFLQFVNIGIVIIIVNFNWLAGTWLTFMPVLNGDY